MAAMAVRSLVIDTGAKLHRSPSEVGPFVKVLVENWYDSAEGLAEASVEDLTALGLPRRFAVELIAAAAEGQPRGNAREGGAGKGKDRGKGKSKGKHRDDHDDTGKGGKGRSGSKGKSKGSKRVDLRHTIPIDLQGVDGREFKFRPKILGNKGANVFHIQDQTGVSLELTGADEDNYMELVLNAKDEQSMDRAVSMCEDLIGAAFDDYEEWRRSGKAGRKGDRDGDKGKGKGKKGDRDSDKGKGKGRKADRDGDKGKSKGKQKGKVREPGENDFEATVPVNSEGIDPEFHLRAKLVGEGGRNVKHIEQNTGACVQVLHDDGDGMRFKIFGADEDAVELAKDMCEDLLSSVLEEAGAAPTKRSRGKGAGKGKRKAEDADAEKRPHKASKTAE